jgi:hypothetical protein
MPVRGTHTHLASTLTQTPSPFATWVRHFCELGAVNSVLKFFQWRFQRSITSPFCLVSPFKPQSEIKLGKLAVDPYHQHVHVVYHLFIQLVCVFYSSSSSSQEHTQSPLEGIGSGVFMSDTKRKKKKKGTKRLFLFFSHFHERVHQDIPFAR